MLQEPSSPGMDHGVAQHPGIQDMATGRPLSARSRKCLEAEAGVKLASAQDTALEVVSYSWAVGPGDWSA